MIKHQMLKIYKFGIPNNNQSPCAKFMETSKKHLNKKLQKRKLYKN